MRVVNFRTQQSLSVAFDEPHFPVAGPCHVPLYLTADALIAFSRASRRELVDEMLMFEQTPLAEQLCRLNNWDRHTLNSHQLEMGLKYRQLDVVQSVLSTIDEDQIEYACQLLVATTSEAFESFKGADFASRLLKVALEFVTRAMRHSSSDKRTTELAAHLTALRKHLHTPSQTRPAAPDHQLLVEGIINNLSGAAAAPPPPPAEGAEGAPQPSARSLHAQRLFGHPNVFGKAFAKHVQPWKLQANVLEVVKASLLQGSILYCQVFCALRYLSLVELGGTGDEFTVTGDYASIGRLLDGLVYLCLCQRNFASARAALQHMGQGVLSYLLSVLNTTCRPRVRSIILEFLSNEFDLSQLSPEEVRRASVYKKKKDERERERG